jgi:hypothetical protein
MHLVIAVYLLIVVDDKLMHFIAPSCCWVEFEAAT